MLAPQIHDLVCNLLLSQLLYVAEHVSLSLVCEIQAPAGDALRDHDHLRTKAADWTRRLIRKLLMHRAVIVFINQRSCCCYRSCCFRCCHRSPSVLPCAAVVFIFHASSVGLWSVRLSPAMSGGDFPHRRDESFFQSAL